MARCEGCEGKFTGLENGDPTGDGDLEIGDVEVGPLQIPIPNPEWKPRSRKPKMIYRASEGVAVPGSVSLDRNCDGCGDTKKQGQIEVEALCEITKDCASDDAVNAPADKLGHDLEIACDDPTADEGGGGRYAKNMISVAWPFTITCARCGEEWTGDATGELAAGEFEEV